MGRLAKYVRTGVSFLVLTYLSAPPVRSQNGSSSSDPDSKQQVNEPPQAGEPIRARSNLVLVPALVKTKVGEIVFSLTAADFTLTDNGVPQQFRLEADTDSEPLAKWLLFG
jgi:hypothetical protein